VALVRQRMAARHARTAIDSLQRDVDSLARLKHAVLTDPAVQERIAREEFGMIKGKEILYRFAPAESGGRKATP
jgi:cell division protein FtsB